MSKSKLVMTPENIEAYKNDFLYNINTSFFMNGNNNDAPTKFIKDLFKLDKKECDSIGLNIFKATYAQFIVVKYCNIIGEEV